MVGGGLGDGGEEFYLSQYTILHNGRFYSDYVIFLQWISNVIFGKNLGYGSKLYVGGIGVCVCPEVEEARWGEEHT